MFVPPPKVMGGVRHDKRTKKKKKRGDIFLRGFFAYSLNPKCLYSQKPPPFLGLSSDSHSFSFNNRGCRLPTYPR